MSTSRTRATYSTTQPMGTNGRLACLWCKGDITDRKRRTFCGKKCAEDFRILTDPQFARYQVFLRDNGICAVCGLDSFRISHMNVRRARGSGHLWQADHIVPVVEGGGECGLDNFRTLCTPCHKAATAELARRRADARKAPTLFATQ